MFRSFLGALTLLCAIGCDETDDDPARVRLAATTPESTSFGWPTTSRFAVGLRSELQANDGYTPMITGVTCLSGCRVESMPSTMHPLFGSYRLTPLEKTFRVRVSVVGRHGRDSADLTFERELTAAETTFATTQDGAGPGTPFLEGMTVAWSLAVKDKSIAWDPAASTVVVTGPFAITKRTASREGINIEIKATRSGAGRLTHRNGEVEAVHALIAVDPSLITALHAVRVRDGETPDLRAASDERLVVSSGERTKLWVVFETTQGLFGIGGAGESLPAPGACFTVQDPNDHGTAVYKERDLATLQSQPQLALTGASIGTSNLLLRVGDTQDSVQVKVVH